MEKWFASLRGIENLILELTVAWLEISTCFIQQGLHEQIRWFLILSQSFLTFMKCCILLWIFFSKKSQLLVIMLNKLQKTNRNQFVNEEYPIVIYWKRRGNYKRFKHKSFGELICRRDAFLELLHDWGGRRENFLS